MIRTTSGSLKSKFYAADASSPEVRKAVPLIHIRCMMTASFRATATLALAGPVFFASDSPQVCSVDLRRVRVSKACAASNNKHRNIASPHFEILPVRSTSPDWYRRGVSPRYAATSLAFEKRSGESMVATYAAAVTYTMLRK